MFQIKLLIIYSKKGIIYRNHNLIDQDHFSIVLFLFVETSRISSRGKGSVCSKGGGDSRTLSSDRRSLNGNTITTHDCLFLRELTSELTSTSLPTWYHRLPGFLRATSDGHAACMIIEDYPPTPPATAKPRQYSRHQDTTQRFLNLHLVLPKHRTSKFSRFVVVNFTAGMVKTVTLKIF